MSYEHALTVRFRDCDSLGHVNNAVYLTYLEEARIHWIQDILSDLAIGAMPIILASAQIDYRSPARFSERLIVSVRVVEVRTRSFKLAYDIACGARKVADAQTVLVTYDYDAGRTIPIPEDLKNQLQAALEPCSP